MFQDEAIGDNFTNLQALLAICCCKLHLKEGGGYLNTIKVLQCNSLTDHIQAATKFETNQPVGNTSCCPISILPLFSHKERDGLMPHCSAITKLLVGGGKTSLVYLAEQKIKNENL